MPRLDPSRAVVYCRTSTGRQDLSPEAQAAACRAFADREGLEVVAEFADVASGGAPLDKRPGLADALAAMRDQGAGVLLVARRDRLGRDVALVATIEADLARHHGRVLAAEGAPNGDTPEARLLRQLLDAIGEYERSLIAARTRAALRAKARRGEAPGGTARYGERVGPEGRLEVDPAEAAALARIGELHADGLGCRRIAAALDDEGHPCRGRAWRPGTVAAIVRRLSA